MLYLKSTLQSARDDSGDKIVNLQTFFLSYQRLIHEILAALGIDYVYREQLQQILEEKLGPALTDFVRPVLVIEHTLNIFILPFIAADARLPVPSQVPNLVPYLVEELAQVLAKTETEESIQTADKLLEMIDEEFRKAGISHSKTFTQDLYDTLGAQRLKSRYKLRDDYLPQKIDIYMSTFFEMRRKLCIVLYDQNPKAEMAVWKLKVGFPYSSVTEKCFLQHRLVRVPRGDINQNGRYRAICRLTIMTQDKRFWGGTGFLVNCDTVVTAAHCVRDDYATNIRVDVGYCGGGKVQHEIRWGKHVAINWGYHISNDYVYDFAVIRLDKPFNKVQKYFKCGSSSKQPQIAVAGYPLDPNRTKENKDMYISKGPKGDIKDRVLRYKLDTSPGHSGSPVLEVQADKSLRAIGVHSGGNTKECNFASMMNQMGNDIAAFEDSFKILEDGGGQLIDSTQVPQIWRISPPTKRSVANEKGHRKRG
ncbi:trypsin-like cysteine/serine peptidase domain-containing protein [Annulohypoxylon nitens]|nr:trypsin-like cysteine/serine peptidase domain-containing protein [Annulohypoxylon nitens]